MSAIVLFDGVCNFCNGTVNFIIEHDKSGHFKFAPLQSEAGKDLADEHGITAESTNGSPDSVILIEDDTVYIRSTAVLRIARHLEKPWSWLSVFEVIPSFVRDSLYKLFAKYRYNLFGKMDQCMVPTPEVRSRFLD